MSKCPFLKLVGITSFINCEPSLNYFIRFCPFICRLIHSSNKINSPETIREISKSPKLSEQCSKFDEAVFNYERFAEEKLNDKIKNSTYRVFKKINRIANSFPMAKSFENLSEKLLKDDDPQSKISCKSPNVTVWCSNDYLGMSQHSAVVSSAIDALKKFGVGAGGTRNISGNTLFHEILETQIADWYQKPSGLIFTSCYVANVTTLMCLGKLLPDCIIFSDLGNHASMIEGIRSSRALKHIFRHNDPEHLEQLLSQVPLGVPKIVAFESINSMNGSIASIKTLCDIAHKYGAITFIDEVHAVGLYGKRGSGLGEHQNCLQYMDIISGTLGKAVGSMGGFIVGSKNIVDLIRSYGSGFIFTTSLPPVLIHAAISAINILQSEEGVQLRHSHQANAVNLRRLLTKNGFPLFPSPSHIVPVHIGNAKLCQRISDKLLHDHNIYVQSINYPTVPFKTERLRLAPTPFHSYEDTCKLVHNLVEVWSNAGLEFLHNGCASRSCSCEHVCGNRLSEIVLPECISTSRIQAN